MPISAIDQPGRAHIQRDLKHLVREVRQDVKAEVKELRAAGATGTLDAVREATFDFRDQVQSAFRDAGSGGSFDAAQVPEDLRQALVAYTDALRAINGPARNPVEPAVPDGNPTPAGSPGPGALLDLTA